MATPAITREVRIERGTFEDLDAVMHVMGASFGERFGEAWTRSQLAGILPMAGVALTLACEGSSSSVVGFSLARTVADESELLLIAVLPERHRLGVGGRLLERFIEDGRAKGIARVHLEVRDGNPAVEMYQNAGFSRVGRRRNYYHASDGRRFDALTLARKI